jgi:hypothetical protein
MVQKYSGYCLLIFFSYGGQSIFYTRKQDKITLVFSIILFSLLVATYVRICQKVIENMFRQIEVNLEHQNLVKSILDNLEESILIKNESKDSKLSLDYINDKFFIQFQSIMEKAVFEKQSP